VNRREVGFITRRPCQRKSPDAIFPPGAGEITPAVQRRENGLPSAGKLL